MQLYIAPGSCSLAPQIVALEAAIPLELIRVDFATKKTAHGLDYHEVNPKGAVPALVTRDGEVLTEAAVIIQYLSDLAPGAQLLPPPGGFVRYRALEWLNFIATELHKGFAPLWNPNAPRETVEAAKAQLARKFGYLDELLGGRDYLLGSRFTAPDAYAFTILRWSRLFEIDLSSWPTLATYFERVGARPAVREALALEEQLGAAA